jgi:hypothetical protein
VFTVDTWTYKHLFRIFIVQLPFDTADYGCTFQSIEARIYIGPVPSGEVLCIFSSPQCVHIIIMFSEFIWSFFALFSSPLDIVLLFALKLVMIFTSFRFLVVFFRFCSALEARGNFFVVFIQKLIQRLRSSRARTFFEQWDIHLTIIVRYSLSFSLRNPVGNKSFLTFLGPKPENGVFVARALFLISRFAEQML